LVELGPGIQPPVLQDEVRLRLPASFVSLYRGSTIEAQVLVSESGEVIDARIDSSPQRTANTAVLQQLHRLRFEPARVGKVRVRCWFPMRISIQ
jgi:outer membrane biosynthesis protein TonB